MASFSNTELNASIDEKWDMDIEDARYANAVIMNRVNNKSAIVQKSGDIIHISIKQKYSVGNVGANGAFVPQVWTLGSTPITVDQHKQVAIEIEEKAAAQSFWEPDSDFPKDAGKALAVQYDVDLANQYTNIATNIIGDPANPAQFDSSMARTAMLKLADTNIPTDDLSFIVPPIAYFKGLMAEMQLTAANYMGVSKNVLTTGYKFDLFGVPVFYSTALAKTNGGTTWRALLLHKQALAIAMQKNNEIRRAERTAGLVFSYVVAIYSLYGLATIREDHSVLMNIAAS